MERTWCQSSTAWRGGHHARLRTGRREGALGPSCGRQPRTLLEVAVEHGLAPHVVPVGHPLGPAVVVLQVGAVDGPDERFTQVELVDLEQESTPDGLPDKQAGQPPTPGR